MNDRCNNPENEAYERYGGRGITVCQQWRLLPNPKQIHDIKIYNRSVIDNFILWAMNNGWTNILTIDRKDNNQGYNPENCRWATVGEQNRNQRKRKLSTSKFYGVSYVQHWKVWTSTLNTNNKTVTIGYFDEELDAAKAYNNYVSSNNLPHQLNVFTSDELSLPIKAPKIKVKTSKYRGVRLKKTNKWASAISIDYKSIHIGYFNTEIDAAIAYNNYIINNNLNKQLNNIDN